MTRARPALPESVPSPLSASTAQWKMNRSTVSPLTSDCLRRHSDLTHPSITKPAASSAPVYAWSGRAAVTPSQAVSRELIGIGKLVEVGVRDHKAVADSSTSTCESGGARRLYRPHPRQPGCGSSLRLPSSFIPVLQGHQGEHEVAALVGERQLCCIRASIVAVRVRFSSSIIIVWESLFR